MKKITHNWIHLTSIWVTVNPYTTWIWTTQVHLYTDFFQYARTYYSTAHSVVGWIHSCKTEDNLQCRRPGLGWSPAKEMATYSSTLAWEIPWTEEPGGLQSTGVIRVGHDLATKPPPPRLVLELMPFGYWGTTVTSYTQRHGNWHPSSPSCSRVKCNRIYWHASWPDFRLQVQLKVQSGA